MRNLLACLILAAAPAWGQAPSTGQPPSTGKAPATIKAPATDKAIERSTVPCANCGVVRSVKVIRKELQPTPSMESQPSGLIASVPLGGGKPSVGSSNKYGKDAVTISESWEVTVRLDDGRFRLLRLGEEPEVREGDKVRIDANGAITLRTD